MDNHEEKSNQEEDRPRGAQVRALRKHEGSDQEVQALLLPQVLPRNCKGAGIQEVQVGEKNGIQIKNIKK